MNFDTVEVVIDRMVSTFGLREWQEDMDVFIEDIAEALKLIGAAKLFAEDVAVLTFNQRVARLPLNCENIMGLVPTGQYYRESGSYIEMDVADGTEVSLQYQAMPIDTRGWPLVPDSAAVRQALMWFMVRNLTLRGGVKSITYQMAESEWQWRCKSARADLNAMSVQQTNQVYQNFVRLNPLKNQHQLNYAGIGKGNTLDREKFRTEIYGNTGS